MGLSRWDNLDDWAATLNRVSGDHSMAVSKDDVLAALGKILSPEGKPLTATATLSDIVVTDGKVFFSITADAAQVQQWEGVRERAQAAVRAVPGVQSAMIALTAERAGGARGPAGAPPPRRPRDGAGRGASGRGEAAGCASGAWARTGRPGGDSRRRRDHRGCLRQRRCRQIDGRGQSRRSGCATWGLRSAFSMPTFTGRRCRSFSPSASGRRRPAARD